MRPRARCMACPRQPPKPRRLARSCRSEESAHAWPDSYENPRSMSEPLVSVKTPLDPQRLVGLPDYHVMVLLVDDQAMVCEAVRRALANQPDIDFHYCADPREAITIANQIKPTVILQDLVMPGIDGLTLVNQYRANPGTR